MPLVMGWLMINSRKDRKIFFRLINLCGLSVRQKQRMISPTVQPSLKMAFFILQATVPQTMGMHKLDFGCISMAQDLLPDRMAILLRRLMQMEMF